VQWSSIFSHSSTSPQLHPAVWSLLVAVAVEQNLKGEVVIQNQQDQKDDR